MWGRQPQLRRQVNAESFERVPTVLMQKPNVYPVKSREANAKGYFNHVVCSSSLSVLQVRKTVEDMRAYFSSSAASTSEKEGP
jgi:hypothetical protein